MNLNHDIIAKVVKSALESHGIKSIPGVNIDDLIKTISEQLLKSVDIKAVGEGLVGDVAKNLFGK